MNTHTHAHRHIPPPPKGKKDTNDCVGWRQKTKVGNVPDVNAISRASKALEEADGNVQAAALALSSLRLKALWSGSSCAETLDS